jgi:hypothetical protein
MAGAAFARAALVFALILLGTPVLSKNAATNKAQAAASSGGGVAALPTDPTDMAKVLIEHQKQLMAEQNALLKRLESLDLATAVADNSLRQQCNATQQPESDDDDEGFPFVSLSVLLVGCGCLFKLLHTEIGIYSQKKSSESEVVEVQTNIPISEFLQYRLDYYFSATQWAKPLLLLGITFILILVSTVILMVLLGDSLAAAMWKAWTYVADPGQIPNSFLHQLNMLGNRQLDGIDFL